MVEKLANANVWFKGPRNEKQNDKYNGAIVFLPGGFVKLKRTGVILPSHRVIEIKDKTITDND